ncbi:Hypothetical predicted protein [Octopus vulgaris]|uniref:Uncharacterized protein n=1 Tax=Octopus vulgaris TaxID=6645 RepID=A0AA36BHY6_OCTVU|nr:Hypothetical predicted protein [Octopus vulgaris]
MSLKDSFESLDMVLQDLGHDTRLIEHQFLERLPDVTWECMKSRQDSDCKHYNCLLERNPCDNNRDMAFAYAKCAKSRARANNLTESDVEIFCQVGWIMQIARSRNSTSSAKSSQQQGTT